MVADVLLLRNNLSFRHTANITMTVAFSDPARLVSAPSVLVGLRLGQTHSGRSPERCHLFISKCYTVKDRVIAAPDRTRSSGSAISRHQATLMTM